MKGKVDAYDPIRGFGFLKAEVDGEWRMYFAHNSDIYYTVPGLESEDITFLLPGGGVEFNPIRQPDGRWKATNIIPLNPDGFVVNPLKERPRISREGYVVVAVAEDRTITILGKSVIPTIDATPNFQIYYIGRGTIKGFAVKLPPPTAERVFLLVNPKEEGKTVRRPTPDGLHKDVHRGSFVMEVSRDGHVVVQKLGAHFYGREDNWLVLTTRFQHRYDFSGELTEAGLIGQTPDVGKADANHEFVPAILKGIELMECQSLPPPNPLTVSEVEPSNEEA